MLLRFYNLESGKVEIDGHDITEYNIENLRRSIGYVMQEPILFNQNIKENILFGLPNASDKDIRKVCELANALTFIESDIEDKDKQQMHEFIEKKFAEKLQDLNNKQLSSYFETVDDHSLKEIVNTTFEKADVKALKSIANNVELFTQLLDEVKESKGVKWDDMCVKHEWNVEMSHIDH